jgi:SAM-dependent methyltransferase
VARIPLLSPARSLAALLALAVAPTALAQEPGTEPAKTAPPAKAKAKAKDKAKSPRRGEPRTYMGRPIAPVMTFEGGGAWLVRPEREAEELPDAMLDALEIQPGWTVADVGAGVGYTTMRLSPRVGPKGTVLATDIQPRMLRALESNAKVAKATNIKAILCTPTDTKLPTGAVDLALMVDVYHECSEPEAVLKDLLRALKPGGRLVLVEFRAEDPDIPIKPEHKMTVDQVRKEIEPRGFKFKVLHDFLPWQHIIVFEKPAGKSDKPADGASDKNKADKDKADSPKDQPKADAPKDEAKPDTPKPPDPGPH